MTHGILGRSFAFGIDQINSVSGTSPRIDQVLAREDFAYVLGRAWIIDDGVTFFSETDAGNNMAVWTWSFGP
jgi:hypothetical protein